MACNSADLVNMARWVIKRIDRESGNRGSTLRATLLASQLYEALKLELASTPTSAATKIRVLRAALEQCRRAVRTPVALGTLARELGGVLELLEAAPPSTSAAYAVSALQRRSQFKVIEGGRPLKS